MVLCPYAREWIVAETNLLRDMPSSAPSRMARVRGHTAAETTLDVDLECLLKT